MPPPAKKKNTNRQIKIQQYPVVIGGDGEGGIGLLETLCLLAPDAVDLVLGCLGLRAAGI